MSDELQKLREKRLQELQTQQGQQAEAQQVQRDSQIKDILQKLLDNDAQSRLANIRLARPEFAKQVEMLLIQLYQSGRLAKLTDDQFKALLVKVNPGKRETKIEIR